ncbi:MAG: response regulator, partial [Chloroflexota bacterium]|nr:response regulator [Chloroflexota bacterium]
MSEQRTQGSILVVDDEASIQKLVSSSLRRAGYDVTVASDGAEAMLRLSEAIPDLIVSDVMMPNIDGLELVQRVRADPAIRTIPIVLLTAKGESEDIVTGLELGADDYLPKPFKMAELLARVRSKVERPPVPSDLLTRDRQTSLLNEHAFWEAASREMVRAHQTTRPGCVAVIAIDELSRVQDRLGPRALAELARQTAALVSVDAQPLDVVGRAANGAFLLLLPETEPRQVKRRVDLLSRRVVDYPFTAGGEGLRLTPTVGYAP